jgi:hypothetical protein
MSTGCATITTPRRPVTGYFNGRPVSLYIDAMARRRRKPANPVASTSAAAEQLMDS